MARILSIGSERTVTYEAPQATFITSGSASNSFSSSIYHSGGSGGSSDATTSGHSFQFDNSGANPTSGQAFFKIPTNTTNGYYSRTWVYVQNLPASSARLMTHVDNSGNAIGALVLNTNRTITLQDQSGQIGVASAPISLNTWVCLELYFFNNTGTGFLELEGRINGSGFAQTKTSLAVATNHIDFGLVEETTGYTVFMDDIAMNDTTSTYANGWIGTSSLGYLEPKASGDSTQWTRGGATDTGANYLQVYAQSTNSWITTATLNNLDMYTVYANIPSNAYINFIDLHVLHESAASPATAGISIRVEPTASAGSVSETAIAAATTATLSTATVQLNPVGSVPWKPTDLATFQMGPRLTTQSGSTAYQVNMLWAVVDYTVGVAASITDSSTVTDSIAVTITTPVQTTLIISVFDTSTVSENSVVSGPFAVFVTDLSTVTDVPNVAQALAITLFELTIVDEAGASGGGGGTSGTPIGILAGITQATGGASGTPGNGANVATVNVINLTETVTVTDAVFVPNNALGVSVQDSSIVTDTVVVKVAFIAIVVNDASAVSDSYGGFLQAEDGINILDESGNPIPVENTIIVSIPTEGALSLVETSTVTEFIALSLILLISVSDSSSVTDVPGVAQALAINNTNITVIGVKLWH